LAGDNPSQPHSVTQTQPAEGKRLLLGLLAIMMMVICILEVSRTVITLMAIRSAARDAVQLGAQVGLNAQNVPYYQDCQGMRNTAMKSSLVGGFVEEDVEITTLVNDRDDKPKVCPVDIQQQEKLKIVIHTQFKIIPFLKFFSIPLSGYASSAIRPIRPEDTGGRPVASPTPLPTRTPNLQEDPQAIQIPGTPFSADNQSPTLIGTEFILFPTMTPNPGLNNPESTRAPVLNSNTATVIPSTSALPTRTTTNVSAATPTVTLRPAITATKTFTLGPTNTATPCPIPAESGGCQ
jgi:hypothetical protein